jgi:hypothetical protein
MSANEVGGLPAPDDNESENGKDAVKVAVVDELAKGFGWVQLSE